MWKLFLDDERFPVDPEFVIARNASEAIQMVKDQGMPSEISFDHDLGGDDTAMVFIHWLIDYHLDGNVVIPKDLVYHIHSQNPVGVKNINGLLKNFLSTL